MSLLSHAVAAVVGYVFGAARRPRVVVVPLAVQVERPAPAATEQPEPKGRTAELRARVEARKTQAPASRPPAGPTAEERRAEMISANRARAAALRAKYDIG